MANVTRENIGTLHDKIKVTLAKDDYMPAFEKSLKQHAKNANVPGFRKGMVPAGMLRKMYGQSVLNDEVVRVAGRQLERYLQGERLAIFAQPMILPPSKEQTLNLANPGDIDFEFEIGIKPEVDVDSVIAANPLTRYNIQITDKMLDDETERIKRKAGKVDEQTEQTDDLNLVYLTYEECDAEGTVTSEKKLEDTEEFGKLPAKLREMLAGKGPGFTAVFTPAEVCTAEELDVFMKTNIKTGSPHQLYKLTLTKVGHLLPAEMGTELYEQVFPNQNVTTEAGFRETLKEALGHEYRRIAGERLQNEMFELLVHNTPIELPVTFLKRWMREGGEKLKSMQEVENEWGGFDHQLRWQLITDRVMADSGVQVTMEEVTNVMKSQVLAYFGLGPDDADEVPWIDGYMEKMKKDEKAVDEVYRRLLFSKIFAHLETKFPISETDIDEEAFFKLPDAHSMHHHHEHAHDHAHAHSH